MFFFEGREGGVARVLVVKLILVRSEGFFFEILIAGGGYCYDDVVGVALGVALGFAV